MMIKFTVEVNPVPKERPRLGKNGATYTPRKTKAYENLIGTYARVAMNHAGLDPYMGEVALIATFYRKDYVHCDLDNLLKSVKDACNGIVYIDDAQVAAIQARVYRGVGDNARVEIEIVPIENFLTLDG